MEEADVDVPRVRPGFVQPAYPLTARRGSYQWLSFMEETFLAPPPPIRKGVDLKVVLKLVLKQLLDYDGF